MTHLTILDEAQCAGHCTSGTSNKVWAACLAVEQEEEQAVPISALNAATVVVFLCVHGPHGGALRREPPQRFALQVARKLLQKKWQEKVGKGYHSVAFASFVAALGKPFGLPLLFSGLDVSSATTPGTPTPLVSSDRESQETFLPWRHTAALVKALPFEDMMALFAETRSGEPSSYAVSEKVNGEYVIYHQRPFSQQ